MKKRSRQKRPLKNPKILRMNLYQSWTKERKKTFERNIKIEV
jgi:hypothetical protein